MQPVAEEAHSHTEIRVLKLLRVARLSSSCGLQRIPLVGSQVPHPPLLLLPVCLAEIDAPACILFFCFFSCSHSPHSPLLFFPYHSSFPNTNPSWPPNLQPPYTLLAGPGLETCATLSS